MSAKVIQRFALALVILITSAMCGCATPLPGFFSTKDVAPIRHPDAAEGPVLVRSASAALLDFVGTRIRQAREPLVLIGYNCNDNGKGVTSQVALCREALSLVAAQAPNQIIVSSVLNPGSWSAPVPGVSTVPQEVHSAMVLKDSLLALPVLVLDGGPVTSLNGMKVQNDGVVLSANEVEGGKTRLKSLDAFEASYTLRARAVGSDMPGSTTTVRITTQDRSASTEAGAYLSARVNGARRGLGLRLSVGKSEIDDAGTKQRIAAELAIAQILADYYHVDLSECPCLAPDGAQAERQPPGGPEVAVLRNSGSAQLSVMPEARREALARAALKAMAYLAPEVDSKDVQSFHAAVIRFRRDEGLISSPGSATGLNADDLVYMRNAVIRRLSSADANVTPPTYGGLDLTMFSGGKPVTLNSILSVTVNVPVAGHLTCAYQGEQAKKWYVIFPNSLANTLTAVSRRAPVDVPSNPGGVGSRVLSLSETGLHRVYCVETTAPLAKRLHGDLDFLGAGVAMTQTEMSEYLRKQAGSTWVTDGQIAVRVVDPPKAVEKRKEPVKDKEKRKG